MSSDLLFRVIQSGGYLVFLMYLARRLEHLDQRLAKLIQVVALQGNRREIRAYVDHQVERALTRRGLRAKRLAP